MGTYRIYHVGGGDRLRLGEQVEAAGDAEAIAAAARLLTRGEAAELWRGGRLVGRFDKSGAFTPSA